MKQVAVMLVLVSLVVAGCASGPQTGPLLLLDLPRVSPEDAEFLGQVLGTVYGEVDYDRDRLLAEVSDVLAYVDPDEAGDLVQVRDLIEWGLVRSVDGVDPILLKVLWNLVFRSVGEEIDAGRLESVVAFCGGLASGMMDVVSARDGAESRVRKSATVNIGKYQARLRSLER